ncbi:hypothetical protein [Pedobacter planticolens]|uniref:hypothetical protein n=1 Tax=Pedobacter planticolens TaxID=2679964 RepID=UPI001602C691|nr:hypothetical protein [Pedobacter planticolens]
MIEVFKTDVTNCDDAKWLIDQLHKTFDHYLANFDLEDCDSILRVEYSNGIVDAEAIINFLAERGFYAEVLPDDFQSAINFDTHFSVVQNPNLSDFSEK